MKHRVQILETFDVVHSLGALVVSSASGSDVVDGPREFRTTYKAGDIATFTSKKAASAFVAAHTGKVFAL